MELATQLAVLDATLHMGWTPREQNTEADALTNGCFELFDPARRVHMEVENLELQVIPGLMEAAASLDAEVKLAGGRLKHHVAKKPPPAAAARAVVKACKQIWEACKLCVESMVHVVLCY